MQQKTSGFAGKHSVVVFREKLLRYTGNDRKSKQASERPPQASRERKPSPTAWRHFFLYEPNACYFALQLFVQLSYFSLLVTKPFEGRRYEGLCHLLNFIPYSIQHRPSRSTTVQTFVELKKKKKAIHLKINKYQQRKDVCDPRNFIVREREPLKREEKNKSVRRD